MIIELNFEKKKQNSEKFGRAKSKLQPVNLSESLEILSVNIKEWLTLKSFYYFFLSPQTNSFSARQPDHWAVPQTVMRMRK